MFARRAFSVKNPRHHKLPLWSQPLFVPFFRSWQYLWQYPLSTLAAIFVIGMSLSVPATFYAFLSNLSYTQESWQHAHQISIFLEQDASKETIDHLQKQLEQLPEIEKITFYNAQQSLEEFQTLSGVSEAMMYLANNPFPAVFDIIPKTDFQKAQQLTDLSKRLGQLSGVTQVKLNSIALEKLQSISAFLKHALYLFTGLLSGTVALLIVYVLRQNVFERREEISVLKLIGATKYFILKPFLIQGCWFGFLGALIAWWLSTAIIFWCQNHADTLAQLYQTSYPLQAISLAQGMIFIGISCLVSGLSALLAVSRQIKLIQAS